ncbi:MAG TPA: amidohydrolase family protein [Thermoanaerobaculia bacterium]|nr:amidohydrolase family protein [Thermoanaerobaculia bacterium]
MKRIALLLLAAAAPAALAQTPAPSPTPAPITVLRAARLFDGRTESVVANAAVVVQGDRILAAGPGVAVPAGAAVVDLGDATILPGFIDAHTHLTGGSGESWLQDFYLGLRRPATEQVFHAAENARKTVEAGFTTVRDVGSEKDEDVGLRNAIAAGLVPGPRMLVARYALGATGGHCDNTGFPQGTFGAEPGLERGILHGADEARQAVRLEVKYGADVIKMCASGGVLSLGDDVAAPQLTDAELSAIIDEAHRLGRKTAAHAHGDAAIRAAVKAGVDSIEHGSFATDDTLALMKQHGTYLVPTMLAGEWTGNRSEKFPPAIAAKARAALAAHDEMFRRAAKSGVKIAFGTDSAISPHGLNAQEFALMVRGGLTPAQALRTAGPSAADLLGLSKEIGTIEPGKLADIVVVAGNPLDDVRATEHVIYVMKSGRVVRAPSR